MNLSTGYISYNWFIAYYLTTYSSKFQSDDTLMAGAASTDDGRTISRFSIFPYRHRVHGEADRGLDFQDP